MSEFDPQVFKVEPNKSTFNQMRQDDLMSLGNHVKLEMGSSMCKQEIQKHIMEDHLVHVTKSFEQSVLSTYTQESGTSPAVSSTPSTQGGENKVERQKDKERRSQREQEEIAW